MCSYASQLLGEFTKLRYLNSNHLKPTAFVGFFFLKETIDFFFFNNIQALQKQAIPRSPLLAGTNSVVL